MVRLHTGPHIILSRTCVDSPRFHSKDPCKSCDASPSGLGHFDPTSPSSPLVLSCGTQYHLVTSSSLLSASLPMILRMQSHANGCQRYLATVRAEGFVPRPNGPWISMLYSPSSGGTLAGDPFKVQGVLLNVTTGVTLQRISS